MKARCFARRWPVAVVLLLLARPAIAQVTTGSILGTVRDAAGAEVPGAVVTITEQGKGTSTTYQTDPSGSYVAPFLIPGTYEISVDLQGFKKYLRRGVVLQVNQRARVDVALEIGTLTETTNVDALAPLVKEDSSDVGEVIEERAIKELPLNGRNFATLVYLTPGITPGQAAENLSGASTFNPRGASNFNALGHHANSNAWLVDGIDNNEYTFNTVIVTPSVESVREFKVLAGTFSAEFGRGAGVVSVSTKSGNNDFHGTAFEYYRNDVWDARNFFARPAPVPKPKLRRNQYGAALSGPLKIPGFYDGRNRTFFFVDYSGLDETRGQVFVNTVPTAQTRVGDFSDFRRPNGQLITIYDPLTTRLNPNYNPSLPVSSTNPRIIRDPFPGNKIPANRLNPVGLNVASIYPLPNGSGNFDNYTSTVDRKVNDDNLAIRVDHKAGEKDSFFARWSWGSFKLDAPQAQSSCCLPTPSEAAAKFDLGPFVAGLQNTRLKTQGGAFNWTHIVRANMVNELRLGYAKTVPFTFQSDFGHKAAESLGIQGINVTEFTTGLPNINVTDFTGLSGGPAFLPVNPKQTHYQIEDGLLWVKGKHQLKLGYRFILRKVSPFTNTDTRGSLNFGNNFTNDPATNTGGTGLATLLTGYSTGGARGFLLEPYNMTNSEHSAYVQDDFRVSDRLTLNLGLRYEVYVPDTEEKNRLVNFDPVNLILIYAGENGTTRVDKKTDKNNFAPRVGFAWDVTGNSRNILRGGFGISYYPEPHSASNLLGQQVPYTISQNYAPETNPLSFANVPTIANPFPAIVPVKPMTTAALNAANPRVLGHDFENTTPYAATWQVSYERQLTQSLMTEIGYVGSIGRNIPIFINPNEVQPGTGSNASRRLIQPLNNMNNILLAVNDNESSYHSLQLKVVKRFAHGLQFLGSYTFGKSLDYGGSAASGGGAVGNGQTVTRRDLWRGPSGYDVKHRAVLSYVWDLPWGSGRKWLNTGGPLAALLGDWQFSGITTFSTGRPFTVFLNTGVNNGAPSWPNRIGSGKLDNPTVDKWFNTADFVAPPPNTYGSSGRGVLYAPGHTNFDVALAKRIPIKGSAKVQLRADAFNLFNHPSFGFPNANIGSPTAGKITTTLNDNRILQLALKLEF